MTKRNLRRIGGPLTVLMALTLGAALLAGPAVGRKAPPLVKFGAKLDSSIQPSNSLPAHKCPFPASTCTWVENEARYNVGHEGAPRNGTLKRIRLVAGGPGTFRLEIAKVKASTIHGSNSAKVVRNGPVIHYKGQSQQNNDTSHYNVETFKVNIPIFKGQFLGARAAKTSMVYCSGGGDNTLIYQPALNVGGGFKPATDTDGCDFLLEGVMR